MPSSIMAPSSGMVSDANYLKLLCASAASNLGDGISFVAIPLLATTLTTDPVLIAGLSFAYTVPRLLMSPLSGVVADRTDRRRLMAAANAFRAALLLGLAVLVVTDTATIWFFVCGFRGSWSFRDPRGRLSVRAAAGSRAQGATVSRQRPARRGADGA